MEAVLNKRLRDKSWDKSVHGYPIIKEAVEIDVDLQHGSGAAVMHGGDLTTEYIHINADYRS